MNITTSIYIQASCTAIWSSVPWVRIRVRVRVRVTVRVIC